MIEFTPCKCNVCTWLDTPKDQRRTTETQTLRGVKFVPQVNSSVARAQREEKAARERRYDMLLEKWRREQQGGDDYDSEIDSPL